MYLLHTEIYNACTDLWYPTHTLYMLHVHATCIGPVQATSPLLQVTFTCPSVCYLFTGVEVLDGVHKMIHYLRQHPVTVVV